MSVTSITNNNYCLPPAGALTNKSLSNVGSGTDGSDTGNRIGNTGNGSGAFMGAVLQALSQAGVTTGGSPANSDASGSSTSNPGQALGDFLHNLFTTLRAQSISGTPPASQLASADGTGSTSATQGTPAGQDTDGDHDGSGAQAVSASGGHHHHHGGGIAKMETNLQNLIQQLSSTSDTSGNGTATSDGSTPDAALQQSYTNLVNSLGGSSNVSTLGNFLQALSQNLQHLTPTGNVVSTQA